MNMSSRRKSAGSFYEVGAKNLHPIFLDVSDGLREMETLYAGAEHERPTSGLFLDHDGDGMIEIR